MTKTYWKESELEALEKAETYSQISHLVLRVLGRMPQPVGEMCGPISTGGAGSIEKNFKRFADAISKLRAEGVEILELAPTQEPIQRIKQANPKEGYDQQLLDELFLPIFESGLIQTFYMLPDWKSSTGATWEHEQAKRLGIDIVYLDENDV